MKQSDFSEKWHETAEFNSCILKWANVSLHWNLQPFSRNVQNQLTISTELHYTLAVHLAQTEDTIQVGHNTTCGVELMCKWSTLNQTNQIQQKRKVKRATTRKFVTTTYDNENTYSSLSAKLNPARQPNSPSQNLQMLNQTNKLLEVQYLKGKHPKGRESH